MHRQTYEPTHNMIVHSDNRGRYSGAWYISSSIDTGGRQAVYGFAHIITCPNQTASCQRLTGINVEKLLLGVCSVNAAIDDDGIWRDGSSSMARSRKSTVTAAQFLLRPGIKGLFATLGKLGEQRHVLTY